MWDELADLRENNQRIVVRHHDAGADLIPYIGYFLVAGWCLCWRLTTHLFTFAWHHASTGVRTVQAGLAQRRAYREHVLNPPRR